MHDDRGVREPDRECMIGRDVREPDRECMMTEGVREPDRECMIDRDIRMPAREAGGCESRNPECSLRVHGGTEMI